MVGSTYGVRWMESYNATDDPTGAGGGRGGGGGGNYATDADLVPDALRPNRTRELLGPGEHPFATKYATRTLALAIEPSIYLDALVRDFLQSGGRIVIRTFDTPRDLMSLAEPIVVNCTGLGSYTLFNDKELVPVKGQLTRWCHRRKWIIAPADAHRTASTPLSNRWTIVLGRRAQRRGPHGAVCAPWGGSAGRFAALGATLEFHHGPLVIRLRAVKCFRDSDTPLPDQPDGVQKRSRCGDTRHTRI